MKKYLALAFVFVALLTLAFLAPSAQAGTIAGCWSDPASGPAGTVFTIHCGGFTPNVMVAPYVVEPDGAASSPCAFLKGAMPSANGCQFKVDENGNISFSFYSGDKSLWGASLGTWTMVVEELGPGHTVIWHAEAAFTVTGGSESVSGAKIWGSADQIIKDQDYTLYGSGFAPNEIVTVWWEFPNGDCSSFTVHEPPFINFPFFTGLSTHIIDNVKADESGSFALNGWWAPFDCEGKYHWVARGNTSGNGGETWVTVTGNAIDTNAWLWADKDTVAGINESIRFDGAGFDANESVTCWLRTPHNQAMPIFHVPELKTNESGTFSFTTWTGGFFPGYNYFSEGALGVYAMTCRGNVSGATAISEFTVTGGIIDP